MVSNIRVWFDPELVNAETVCNLHRFGNNISKSLRAGFTPTDEQVRIATMFNQHPFFDLLPSYPLRPDGTVEEMLAGRLDPPDEKSWDFYATFHATCTKEMKDALILMVLKSPLVARVTDGRI